MLVMTRRLKERILIPAVGAAVEVVALGRRAVRLGVAAPPHVAVLREEVYRARAALDPLAAPGPVAAGRAGGEHVVRNRLNNVGLGLAVLRARMAGAPADARAVLEQVQAEFLALCGELLAGPPATADAVGAA